MPQSQSQPRPAPLPAQRETYGRKPGGWQYERDQDDYYADNVRPYEGEYATPPPQPPQSKGRGASKVSANPNRSYLSVNIEGARPRKNPFAWLLWVLVGVLAIGIVVALAFSLAWQGQYAGKVYAGVKSLGVDLSGKTPEEAKKLLDDKVQAFIAQPVVLQWHGKEWRPSADQIGLTVDTKSTVDNAFKVGRSGDMMANLAQQWYSAQSGYGVPVIVQLNEPALQTYLNSLASTEIDQTLFEGDVRLMAQRWWRCPARKVAHFECTMP